jgi:integrase
MKAIDVTEQRIEKYKATRLGETTQFGDRPVKPATVNRELAALRRAFKIAVRQKRIAVAPTIELLEENNIRQGFLEPGEFNVVCGHLPEHLRDFARFGYITGWRVTELRTLRWADVNRDAQLITLRSENSKNPEPRILPLTGELSSIIVRRHQERSVEQPDGSTIIAEFVFHRRGGQIRDFRRAWALTREAAGKPGLHFHDLRRSAVRNMDKSGVSASVGMLISGHKTKRSTGDTG